MKKSVLTLAVASCFALGFSMAQASTHSHEHSTADEHGDAHGHGSSLPYAGHTDLTGQTHNVKVGADGVRLPYNMAQDKPSVSDAQNGVRPVRGAANPMFAYKNTPKTRMEPDATWGMSGTNRPAGSNHNDYIHSFGAGYNAR